MDQQSSVTVGAEWNSTTNGFTLAYPEDLPDDNSLSQLILYTTYIVVAASGIPGNVLVIVVIGGSKIMRNKPANVFIMHQSVVDIVTGVAWILRTVGK